MREEWIVLALTMKYHEVVKFTQRAESKRYASSVEQVCETGIVILHGQHFINVAQAM